MKRHEALKVLSSDHHQGLVWGRNLQKLSPNITFPELQTFLSQFMEVWEKEIHPHFQEEESILLPLFAIDGEYDTPCIREMLMQHIQIRKTVLLLQKNPDASLSSALGKLLQQHIRLEEGEVFPLVEQQCSETTLQLIGEMLHGVEASES